MRLFTTILGFLLAASPALAVDPECLDAINEPPTFQGCQLKMDGLSVDLRFCSPQFDIDGDPIPEANAIASCTVTLDDVTHALATVDRPGQLFSVNLTSKNPGHVITAFCTTTEGLDGEVWVSDVCFPAGKPGKPHKK